MWVAAMGIMRACLETTVIWQICGMRQSVAACEPWGSLGGGVAWWFHTFGKCTLLAERRRTISKSLDDATLALQGMKILQGAGIHSNAQKATCDIAACQ